MVNEFSTIEEEILTVAKIENGTVIDRIPPGKSLRVLEVLGIDSNYPYVVALAMRVPSVKMKVKDVVKIKGKALTKKEIQTLTFIAPHSTVNIIKNFKVINKTELTIPKKVEEIINCINPNCVTNAHEPVVSSFDILSEEPLILRCVYCDRLLQGDTLQNQL